MDPTQHPGLRFRVGDIVMPVKRYHPIMLRSDPHTVDATWDTCPIWRSESPGIIVDIKVDLSSIGEVVIKLVTPDGVGWIDWWSINQS